MRQMFWIVNVCCSSLAEPWYVTFDRATHPPGLHEETSIYGSELSLYVCFVKMKHASEVNNDHRENTGTHTRHM